MKVDRREEKVLYKRGRKRRYCTREEGREEGTGTREEGRGKREEGREGTILDRREEKKVLYKRGGRRRRYCTR